MLATLGDLVDDIVVQLSAPINVATDTPSVISRRRGGSAANVAATAGVLNRPVRFLGQVGTDAIGAALIAELDDPRPEWLDDVTTLHVPLYSLVGGTTATTASTLIGWAHERGVAVSLDLSSTALMTDTGLDAVRGLVARLRPSIVFANQSEADLYQLDQLPADAIAVVKNGPDPALLRVAAAGTATAGTMFMIPAIGITDVADTTGAGDAFAAGFLTFREWRQDPAEACIHAHRAARRILTGERR